MKNFLTPYKLISLCALALSFSTSLVHSQSNNTYDDHHTDNSEVNSRDKDGKTLLPQNQSSTKYDRQVTQKIRRAIVKENQLSQYAKNIKIITVNGKVTLRGPVKNVDEINKIVEISKVIAGEQNVINQLEVSSN